MTRRTSLGVALLATIAAASAVVAHVTRPIGPTRSPGPSPDRGSVAPEPSPIDPLDGCIQYRLHEHPGFGIARIGSFLRHVQDFEPETPAETRTLTELRRSGWTVGLRLGSRSLLIPGPVGPVPTGWDSDRDLSEPIAVTGPKSPADLPGRDDLREIARRAMIGADSADSANGKIGRWSVEARVVRVDRESCLKCHSRKHPVDDPPGVVAAQDRLKIGDALGVAIYVYARDLPRK